MESIQLIHVDVDQLSTESLYPTFSLSIPVSRQSSRLHLSTTKAQSIPKILLRYTVSFMVFSIVTFPGLATAVLKYIGSYATKHMQSRDAMTKALNIRQLIAQGVYFMVVSTFLINTVVQAGLLLVGSIFVENGAITPEILLAFMLYQGQLQVR